MAISFQFNQISKPIFFKATKIKPWLKAIAAKENFLIKELNYVFMCDEDLLKINLQYLNHDTYTDIITFDNADASTSSAQQIESDIFISLDRVAANAKKFNTTVEKELQRVMAHGLLHLCGYKDKKKADIEIMRKKEEECLMRLL